MKEWMMMNFQEQTEWGREEKRDRRMCMEGEKGEGRTEIEAYRASS